MGRIIHPPRTLRGNHLGDAPVFRVRWSIDLRYQSTEVPNNVDEDPASYTPERDPVTMACYPPEADWLTTQQLLHKYDGNVAVNIAYILGSDEFYELDSLQRQRIAYIRTHPEVF